MGPIPNRTGWLRGRVSVCHAGDPCSNPAQGTRARKSEREREQERERERESERER